MDNLITFEKLTAKHLPYLYEIRFSHPKRTCCIRIRSEYLQRKQYAGRHQPGR